MTGGLFDSDFRWVGSAGRCAGDARLGRVFHFAGVSVSTFELGKKFEEFRVTEVRFLCEQDGPPERRSERRAEPGVRKNFQNTASVDFSPFQRFVVANHGPSLKIAKRLVLSPETFPKFMNTSDAPALKFVLVF